MTLYQPEERKSNKPLWIFLSAGLALIAVTVVLIFVFVNNSSEPNPENTNAPNASGSGTTPPAVNEFTASVEGENLVFQVTTEEYDTSKWFIEYELADQNRVVEATGTERSNQFTVETEIGDSAYYRLKVRLTNDTEVTGWSENATVELEEVEGVNMLEPTPAYFDTEWAKGHGSIDNLKNALRTAYAAEEITFEDTYACIPLNTGTMTPGLLLPPIPSVKPNATNFGFLVQDYDESSDKATVTYVWC